MKTTYDRDARRLRLGFDSSDEIASFVEAAHTESGFLVTLPVGLRLHETVTVVLSADKSSSTVQARVAQVFDKGFGRFSTAFVVDDWAALANPSDRDERPAAETDPGDTGPVRRRPEEPAETGPKPPAATDASAVRSEDDDSRADLEDEAEGAGNEGEMRGTSPIHDIKTMNPGQRAMLAMKASRTQRRILLRDRSPQVLQNLLANPRIDSKEVLHIARSSHVVAPILQRIASDARWGSNQEILGVIARHPQTPSLFAARLMPTLRTSDLRTMAKMSSGLKEMTRKAALREYMRRTGQRI